MLTLLIIPFSTDFGSLTLLFSQHVAGLQIRTPEGEWKYVKPVPGGITCNAADTLSFITKGTIGRLRFESRADVCHRIYQVDYSSCGDTPS